MDVLIRNCDPTAIKKLEEIAQKKSISRNEYLKSLLMKVAYEPERNERESQLELIIEKNTMAMKEMNNRMLTLEKILHELMED